MRRREFIALFGGASALWLLAARAQQSMPVVGFLGSGSAASAAPVIAAFRRGLGEIGYIEGKNVTFEYSWGEGQNSRLAALATDLVRRQMAVIVTTGGTPPALAAKAATSSIPIVFGVGTDPIAFGLVTSLNKPGGNLTGVTALFDEVAPKRLALLLELVPSAKIVGLLVNPSNPSAETQSKDLRQAVDKLGLELHVVNAKTDSDLEAAFAVMTQKRRRAPDRRRRFPRNPEETHRGASGARSNSDHILRAKFPDGWRFDELWWQLGRYVSLGRRRCRTNSQRRKARRPAGPAVHKARAGDQP